MATMVSLKKENVPAKEVVLCRVANQVQIVRRDIFLLVTRWNRVETGQINNPLINGKGKCKNVEIYF